MKKAEMLQKKRFWILQKSRTFDQPAQAVGNSPAMVDNNGGKNSDFF
jgi:hypothetical protein